MSLNVLLKEVWATDDVVVNEKDQAAFRHANTIISGSTGSPIGLFNDPQGAGGTKLVKRLSGAVGGPIDDNDDLKVFRRDTLVEHSGKGSRNQNIPAVMCGHHDGEF